MRVEYCVKLMATKRRKEQDEDPLPPAQRVRTTADLSGTLGQGYLAIAGPRVEWGAELARIGAEKDWCRYEAPILARPSLIVDESESAGCSTS